MMNSEKISLLIEKERKRVREGENGDYVNELQVNRQKEFPFRLMVFEMLQESKDHMWEEGDLVNSCAEELCISPTTSRKYLGKVCSSRGVLKKIGINNSRYITFKLDGLLQ